MSINEWYSPAFPDDHPNCGCHINIDMSGFNEAIKKLKEGIANNTHLPKEMLEKKPHETGESWHDYVMRMMGLGQRPKREPTIGFMSILGEMAYRTRWEAPDDAVVVDAEWEDLCPDCGFPIDSEKCKCGKYDDGRY
jgi:hypothetical protein